MTAKLILYACVPALLLAGTPVGAQAPPPAPCGECLRLGIPADEWPLAGPDPAAVAIIEADALVSGGPSGLPENARTFAIHLAAAEDPAELVYVTRRALAEARGARPNAALGVMGTAAEIDTLIRRGVAPYLDFVAVVQGGQADRQQDWLRLVPGLRIWIVQSWSSLFDALRFTEDPRSTTVVFWPPPPLSDHLLESLRLAAQLFPAGLVPADDLAVTCDPPGLCTTGVHRQPDGAAWIVHARRTAGAEVSLLIPARGAELFHVSTAIQPLVPAIADASGRLKVALPHEPESMLVARVPAEGARISEDVTVQGARELTAEEIVARHQAVAARQARIIERLITHATTTVTFELPVFPAPVTVQAETTILDTGDRVELAQRDIRVNGIAFDTAEAPRLPLIEPERVAALPLAITLDRAYAYRLAGRDLVGGRPSYVIRFEPLERRSSLFEGTAWIDAERFGLLKTDAVQTNLRGAITSSQQIDEFTADTVAGETVWLLERSEIRQVYQGAGITTPIHRLIRVHRHEINPADIAGRRASMALGSVILHETPDGLRYDKRGRATRLVTAAGGVLIDPNISRPLPFAGLNYTDFDLFGTGAQFNAFFGGAYGQFALNAPSLRASRWQLAASGFAMLARYNDRSFRAGRERYEENLRQRPAHLAVGLVRPLTARTTARAEYLFDYVALDRAESTGVTFRIPPDQLVHGARLALETQRAGWRVEAWWNPARRAGWRSWGTPASGDYEPASRDFQRFGLNLYRPWMLAPRVVARVDAAWMSGVDLDRFSRYAFGTFENRLRGYPSASIRYDRGGALRTALAWQVGRRIRIDGFADIAVVRDPGFGRAHRGYPGLGAAVEGPGPFGLLLGAEWGYGVKGLNADGTEGTHVVRLTAYKIF